MSSRELVVGIHNGVITITKYGSSTYNDADTQHTQHQATEDQFIWQADPLTVQHFQLDFKYSPFVSRYTTLTDTTAYPQTIDSKSPPYDYKYQVSVTPASNSIPTPSPRDPHIIIDEGGQDPLDHLAAAQFTGAATITAVTDALAQHMNDVTADGKRFFFPFGIQSISVDVKVNLIEVNIQVSGNTVD